MTTKILAKYGLTLSDIINNPNWFQYVKLIRAIEKRSRK